MKAVVFAGPGQVRIDDVPAPEIREPRDAIVRVTKTAICGSDLHLLSGKTPGMRTGGVIGHEFVGTVESLGKEASEHVEGARVLGSFLIACGRCTQCASRRFNLCLQRRALGLGTLTGDLDGAQAEYVRVPDSDVNLKPLSGALAGLDDEHALFGGDIMTTGFYAAALTGAAEGASVVILGAGPIGLFTAAALERRGARPLVLDVDPTRVAGAQELGYEAVEAGEDPEATVRGVTGGELADVAVEAVGSTMAFRSALRVVGDGGRVVVIGVYGSERFDLPMGKVWIRGLDVRFSSMTNIHAHWDEALIAAAKGEIDPTRLISHRLPLEEAERGYELFGARAARKVVLTP